MNELNATNIENNKGRDEFLEVEELIKKTLEESKILEKKPEPAPTPIATQPSPSPSTPAPTKSIQPAPKAKETEKYEATFKEYKVGDIVRGKVIKIDQSGVLVDIKYKADGLILPEELSDKPFSNPEEIVKVGEIISVYIENLENKEGNIVLSKKHADYELHWHKAYTALKAKTLLEGKVEQVLKGGLVVEVNGAKGFLPASQVSRQNNEPLESFKGRIIPVKVIEVNRRQGKIVLSHKAAAGTKEKTQSNKLIEELEVGQIRHGKVASLKSFGAFVDIGGIEGLVHLSELSWRRVKHPSELLKVGQELDVFVLGVDKISKKVALGLKELQDDPWVKATEYFKPGQIVKAKIARFAKFGAFAELDHDLEGLIHISEMSKEPTSSPDKALLPSGEFVKIGDVLDVKILRVLPEEQKIGLSIKAVFLQEEKAALKLAQPKPEEKKVTIADILAEKEKARAEQEADQEEES